MRIEIPWDELKVGDIFVEDESMVTELSSWEYHICYEFLGENGGSIIISDSHLLSVDNDLTFEKSELCKAPLFESSINWLSAEDIYNLIQLGKTVYTHDGMKIISAKLYKDGEPQKCRCISTNTGTYKINGFTNHNTARKLFYAFSDIQVFKDCGGPHIDALHCKLPEGHVCEKCAHATQGGEHVHEGELIGGLISTNVSEPLTQLSMKQMHSILHSQIIRIKRNK